MTDQWPGASQGGPKAEWCIVGNSVAQMSNNASINVPVDVFRTGSPQPTWCAFTTINGVLLLATGIYTFQAHYTFGSTAPDVGDIFTDVNSWQGFIGTSDSRSYSTGALPVLAFPFQGFIDVADPLTFTFLPQHWAHALTDIFFDLAIIKLT